jgi:hypothetical protein
MIKTNIVERSFDAVNGKVGLMVNSLSRVQDLINPYATKSWIAASTTNILYTPSIGETGTVSIALSNAGTYRFQDWAFNKTASTIMTLSTISGIGNAITLTLSNVSGVINITPDTAVTATAAAMIEVLCP